MIEVVGNKIMVNGTVVGTVSEYVNNDRRVTI